MTPNITLKNPSFPDVEFLALSESGNEK